MIPTPEQREAWRRHAENCNPRTTYPERVLTLLDALDTEERRSQRFADNLATRSRESTDAMLDLGRRISHLRDGVHELKVLLDDPGVRHLQPPNWRSRVDAVLGDLLKEATVE